MCGSYLLRPENSHNFPKLVFVVVFLIETFVSEPQASTKSEVSVTLPEKEEEAVANASSSSSSSDSSSESSESEDSDKEREMERERERSTLSNYYFFLNLVNVAFRVGEGFPKNCSGIDAFSFMRLF